MGTCELEWDVVRKRAMEYCKRKKEEGRFKAEESVQYDPTNVPVYDLLQKRDVVP